MIKSIKHTLIVCLFEVWVTAWAPDCHQEWSTLLINLKIESAELRGQVSVHMKITVQCVIYSQLNAGTSCQLRNVRAAERSARPPMEIWQANGSRPAAETDGDQPREKCAEICQRKRHEKTWGPRGKTLFHRRCFQSVSEQHVRELWGRFCSF